MADDGISEDGEVVAERGACRAAEVPINNQDREFLFARLAAPFDPEEVKERSQGSFVASYVTARTVMNRLDDVLGAWNWWDDYVPGEHSVLCRLTIRFEDGMTLAKSDAGGYAGMQDPGDDDKSGFADAFKRAAVKFGVARYLYKDGIPPTARDLIEANGMNPEGVVLTAVRKNDPGGSRRPSGGQRPAQQSSQPRPEAGGYDYTRDEPPPQRQRGDDNAPRTGRALFAWTKKQDDANGYDLLKYLNAWSKRQEFPSRMIDFDDQQVAQCYAEACRKIRAVNAMQQAAESALEN